MPIGILTDVAATFAGGVAGCLIGSRLQEEWKELLNNLMAIAALVMGIVLITRGKNLSAVIMALIIGGCLGQILQLEDRVNRAANRLTSRFMGAGTADVYYLAQVSTVIILFCFSGSGWYGSLCEGMTGDGSIMVTKAILDCVAACIFAALLGKIVPCICSLQLVVFLLLFLVSKQVGHLITPNMVGDFSAMGGIVTLTAGLRLSKMKTDIKCLNLLPGIIAVLFVSALWV